MRSDFSKVFLSASNAIPAVQNIINNPKTNQILLSISTSLLTVSLNLSRLFSYVSCTLPTTIVEPASPEERVQSPPPSSKIAHSNSSENTHEEDHHDQMLVLCRICEEYVPIDLIEQHSQNCVIAYESEFNMITTDERIKKLQKAID